MRYDNYELPKFLTVDLEGYRGYGILQLPLVIEEKCGKWVAAYSHDGAQYCKAVCWGCSKAEVVTNMKKELITKKIKQL